MKILVTGAAGFIGFHAVRYFAGHGYQVVGLDNINDYYDVDLKYARLEETGIKRKAIKTHVPVQSSKYPNYVFFKADLADKEFIDDLFSYEHFDIVSNLAAQAGVRYSISNPYSYINSNVTGFLNILEACRFHPVRHLVYASSSSIYGLNEKVPYNETDIADTPVSLYAATKKSNELMAHAYSKLYGIPTTGLRFFTVYGPWGRPDMAPFLFMDAILNQRPIKVFNRGNLLRDFTYIDDIIRGLAVVVENPPDAKIPYEIYNIGRGKPIRLPDFISELEKVTGQKAIKHEVEMQDGDVYQTFADTRKLQRNLNYKPIISLQEGIEKLYNWYLFYTRQFKQVYSNQ